MQRSFAVPRDVGVGSRLPTAQWQDTGSSSTSAGASSSELTYLSSSSHAHSSDSDAPVSSDDDDASFEQGGNADGGHRAGAAAGIRPPLGGGILRQAARQMLLAPQPVMLTSAQVIASPTASTMDDDSSHSSESSNGSRPSTPALKRAQMQVHSRAPSPPRALQQTPVAALPLAIMPPMDTVRYVPPESFSSPSRPASPVAPYEPPQHNRDPEDHSPEPSIMSSRSSYSGSSEMSDHEPTDAPTGQRLTLQNLRALQAPPAPLLIMPAPTVAPRLTPPSAPPTPPVAGAPAFPPPSQDGGVGNPSSDVASAGASPQHRATAGQEHHSRTSSVVSYADLGLSTDALHGRGPSEDGHANDGLQNSFRSDPDTLLDELPENMEDDDAGDEADVSASPSPARSISPGMPTEAYRATFSPKPLDPNSAIPLHLLPFDTQMGPNAFVEGNATAHSAVAAQRSFVLPSPLIHLSSCLSADRDHAAVLRHDKGRTTLEVLWLGAPEEVLLPITTLQAKPRLNLAFGLSIDPPLGRRGAVPAPVVGRLPLYPSPKPVHELLAVIFAPDGPPKDLRQDQQDWIRGYVTASRPEGQDGKQEVYWHSGPALEEKWVQRLACMQHPRAQISPGGAALVVQSSSPALDPFGVTRVLEGGVWCFRTGRRGPGAPLRWLPRIDETLVPEGFATPTFAWTHNDQETIMVSHNGAWVFDTRPTATMPKLRQAMHLPLPPQLAPYATVAGGAVTFDAHHASVAVNWTAHAPTGDATIVARWGEIFDLKMVAAHGQKATRANPWPLHTALRGPKPTRMVQFVGEQDDIVVATGDKVSTYHRSIDDLTGVCTLNLRKYSGADMLQTAARDRILSPLSHTGPYFAMMTKQRMRLYWQNGLRYMPALRRFVFQENRPHVLHELARRGVKPSPNRLTLLPWFEAHERYLFLGFDDDVLLRLDMRPGRGYGQPNFAPYRVPDHPATFNVGKTLWTAG